MQELIFKNYLRTFILFIFGIAASSGVSLLSINPVEVPLPVFVLGILTGFLVYGFIFYSKATLGQTLQITIIGILINTANLISACYVNSYFGLSQIVLKSDFILYLNPAILGTGFVFSLLVLFATVRLKKIESYENETISEEISPQVEQNTEVNQEQDESENELSYNSCSANENELSCNSCSASEKLFFKNIKEDELTNEQNEKTKENEENEENKKFEELEELEIELDNVDVLDEENIIQSEKDKEEEKNKLDFIPTNIRLVESATPTEVESKGKIGAIGKLFINNRDIENIIESNITVTEGVLSGRTNVISTVSGEKIYEQFNEIQNKFSCIKEMALIDKGGFILANNFEDKQRVQLAGALIAGAYHTLQNYLAQISLPFPIRIFFETQNTNSFILKARDEILFSQWDKDFQHVEYGIMTEIFDIEDFSEIDIMPYADILNIENFVISDSEGNLINALNNNGNSQEFAAVSSAIFENLKIFLMNIQLMKLSKIVIFTPQKVLTVIKILRLK